MPTRIIRDGILTSDRINSLSGDAELFYRRLMSVADDHGRYSANLTLLRASCYPLKIDTLKDETIGKYLAECVDVGLIITYVVDGKPYLQMQDFGQRINGKSRFPEQPAENHGESPAIPGVSRLDVDVDVDVDEGDKRRAPAGAVIFDGVSEQVVADFRALRKAKKAAITQTAVDGIRREAVKAGVSLEAALAMCCERGWTGFKAEWVGGTQQAAQPGGGRRAL